MRTSITILFTLLFTSLFSQGISIASDISIQRNFKKEQRYWALGHTTQAIFHLSPRDGIYTWVSFYTNGRFKNNVTAIAKSPLTSPQQVNYVNNSRMGLKEFSVGWRRYLKGSPDAEDGWNIYAYAGFGLEFGKVVNAHSIILDSTIYTLPVRSGSASFKRLTMDVGAGWEMHLRADYYWYAEGRAWIPTTDYPSKYIFVNNNAPLVAMFCTGIRVFF